MNVLQKLMFWRKSGEAQSAEPLPNSGPNAPLAIDTSETPDEKAGGEERFRGKLLDEE